MKRWMAARIRRVIPLGAALILAVAGTASLGYAVSGGAAERTGEKGRPVFVADTPARPVAGTATGTLRANVPGFQLMLHSPAGFQEIRGEKGEAKLPAGTYTVMRWTAEAPDAQGRRWQARGGMWPEPIRVTPGGVTEIRLASPLRAVLRGFYQMNPIGFRLEFSGTHGELYEGVTVDGRDPEPPRLEIRDAKGKRVADLPFKYG